jgi:hypothetical protein
MGSRHLCRHGRSDQSLELSVERLAMGFVRGEAFARLRSKASRAIWRPRSRARRRTALSTREFVAGILSPATNSVVSVEGLPDLFPILLVPGRTAFPHKKGQHGGLESAAQGLCGIRLLQRGNRTVPREAATRAPLRSSHSDVQSVMRHSGDGKLPASQAHRALRSDASGALARSGGAKRSDALRAPQRALQSPG